MTDLVFYFPLLPMVCSELDFFILSGVFAAFPLEPIIRGLNGKKGVEKLEDKNILFKVSPQPLP